MVINHLERLFVTSDASTIVTELEVNHPAARLVVHAAKAQEAEIGDGTNLVRAAAEPQRTPDQNWPYIPPRRPPGLNKQRAWRVCRSSRLLESC